MNLFDKIKAASFYCLDSIYNNCPRWVHLQVTHRCNNKCIMCETWKKKDQDPSLDSIKMIVSELKKGKVERINLWGGEPYLREDIPEIFSFIKQNMIKCKVTTNGTLFTDKTMNATLDYVDHIVFSIDSTVEEIHDKIRGRIGCYKALTENIETLFRLKKKRKQKTPHIELDCTVQKLNIDDLVNILDLSKKYEATVNFDPVQLNGIGNNNDYNLIDIDKEKIIEQYNKVVSLKRDYHIDNSEQILEYCKQYLLGNSSINAKCICPYINLLVDINGDIHFCWGWDIVVGNIFKNNINQIWRSKKYVDLRKEIINGSVERCRYCCFSHTKWPYKSHFLYNLLFANRDRNWGFKIG